MLVSRCCKQALTLIETLEEIYYECTKCGRASLAHVSFIMMEEEKDNAEV